MAALKFLIIGAIAAILAVAGLEKLAHPHALLAELEKWGLFRATGTGPAIAAILPVVELYIAGLLLVPALHRSGLACGSLLFFAFAAFHAIAWCLDPDGSCRCFGNTSFQHAGIFFLTAALGSGGIFVFGQPLRVHPLETSNASA